MAAKWGAFAQGVASGFVSGGISTGSIRGAINGAITGGFSARLAYTVGHGGVNNSSLFEGSFKTAVAHGVSQGALTRIQGGSFKSGFLGGSIGSYSSTFMNKESGWTNITKRTAIAATAGGIASELGGGKFANGARSAAFVHLFNAEGSNWFEGQAVKEQGIFYDKKESELFSMELSLKSGIKYLPKNLQKPLDFLNYWPGFEGYINSNRRYQLYYIQGSGNIEYRPENYRTITPGIRFCTGQTCIP